MREYLNGLKTIMTDGERRTDRTGVGTISLFGIQHRYDLRKGFPAVTTKKLAWKAVVSELLWFLEGSTDERRLCEILYGTRDPDKKTIWTDNVQAEHWQAKAMYPGDAGQIYGFQMRHWGPRLGPRVDQIKNLIEGIKKDPYSRRHIVVNYNPGEIEAMCLPPCHAMFQFYVNNNNELSCQLYQRSQDVALGGPFNIASYSLLTHMIAQVCGLSVGEFIHTTGDAHIYLNHIDGVNEQLHRAPMALPTLRLNPDIKDIDNFTMADIELVNYISHPPIHFPFAT